MPTGVKLLSARVASVALASWAIGFFFSCNCCNFALKGAPSRGKTSLLKHVGKMLTTRCEVPTSAVPLIVSVSGGQDSVALLRLVHEVAKRSPWHLHVLHFNHGLRPEAAEEELFVKDLAKMLEVRCTTRHHPDPTSLKQSKLGLQAAARGWRQAESKKLLATLEEDLGEKGVILLAHHADDQAEIRCFEVCCILCAVFGLLLSHFGH